MPRTSISDLADFGARLLVAKGVAADKARLIAESAAMTEAAGIATHGAVIFGYWDKMVGGSIDPAAAPRIVREKSATALIDGERVFGQLAMRLASEVASRKAREHGAAVVAVRNTSWIAGLGVYLVPLVRSGFLAQLWVQSCACKDAAPYGGVDARLSTNPVALAFPTPCGPVIADFSTSCMSMGRARRLADAGGSTPLPAFFDKHGRPSRDPKDLFDGGAMMPAGGDFEGYKGTALSVWIEALTAMAGGHTNNPKLEQRQTCTLVVIDPEAFEGGDHYRREMEQFVAHVKSSRVREGFDGIRLPGERMLHRLSQSEREGVELSPSLVATLNEIAARNGIQPLRLMNEG